MVVGGGAKPPAKESNRKKCLNSRKLELFFLGGEGGEGGRKLNFCKKQAAPERSEEKIFFNVILNEEKIVHFSKFQHQFCDF